ncbi:nutrient deprivation-induced protein [Devosia nitrariae]|uniref:Nutrient deprivation-induced protein n=1 Tax=Devosia nitrariae TaxID=2071872 RepID=A0ABQ5W759_9HYPH|nr:nutrient deprivation-induced protein [Devosia nitrariae]GLQ55806.1 nutrient deprivation-induced protein [Devosia nitrariae]
MANERPLTGQNATSTSNPRPDPLSEAKTEARTAAEEIKSEASREMDKARSEVAAGMHRAEDEARSFARDQKDYAAGQLGSIADAVTRVAEELEQQNQTSVARYAREIGQGMRGLSQTAHDSSIDELVHKAQSFGRRNPAAFLGGAALLGFAASRFLTASAHRQETKTTATTTATTTSSEDVGSPLAPH